MSKALATYFATVNDIPDTEFKVEILEDGPIKKVSVNGTVYGYFLDRPVFQNLYLELCVGNIVNRGKISR